MWRSFLLSLGLLFAARPAWAGGFRVGTAFEWQRWSAGRRVAVYLLLELPLDRLAAPRVPRLFAPPRALGEEPAPPERDRAATTPAPAPAPAPVPKPAKAAAEAPASESHGEAPRLIDAALAQRLVKAALRAQGFAAALDRLDGISARARSSAALPELTLRAVRSTDQSLRQSPSGTYVIDYTQTGGAGLLLEARAVWRLDRVVFADEELRVERLRAQRTRLGERLIAEVLKNLFKVEGARRRLADAELGPDERLELELQLLGASSALDVLTDGEFGREEQRQKDRAGNFEQKR